MIEEIYTMIKALNTLHFNIQLNFLKSKLAQIDFLQIKSLISEKYFIISAFFIIVFYILTVSRKLVPV